MWRECQQNRINWKTCEEFSRRGSQWGKRSGNILCQQNIVLKWDRMWRIKWKEECEKEWKWCLRKGVEIMPKEDSGRKSEKKKSRSGRRYLQNTVNDKKEWKVGVSTEWCQWDSFSGSISSIQRNAMEWEKEVKGGSINWIMSLGRCISRIYW